MCKQVGSNPLGTFYAYDGQKYNSQESEVSLIVCCKIVFADR